MNKFSLTRRHLLIGSAATLTMATVARAATLDEIKKRGYMAVATEDDFRPFEFTDNGNPTGYDQNLLAAFKKTVNSIFTRTLSRGPEFCLASPPANMTLR